MITMGLVFRLLSDGHVRLPDPAGGDFDYCGDFDRLFPLATELPFDHGFALEVPARVEAFEDVDFTQDEMPALLRDIEALSALATSGPEQRGLDRLRVMAETCTQLLGSKIRSIGD